MEHDADLQLPGSTKRRASHDADSEVTEINLPVIPAIGAQPYNGNGDFNDNSDSMIPKEPFGGEKKKPLSVMLREINEDWESPPSFYKKQESVRQSQTPLLETGFRPGDSQSSQPLASTRIPTPAMTTDYPYPNFDANASLIQMKMDPDFHRDDERSGVTSFQ